MVGTIGSRTRFELRRQSDDLVYTFVHERLGDGSVAYRRQDQDLWIVHRPDWGWVAWDDASDTCLGRSWNTLPHQQADHPPEGDWVSRKGSKSYVYTLVYVD
ncbi:hypothetical protein ANOBCDAF_04523 [Pleomorphomonas sp. T1.2MG-36]|uniref:hypothetical protein n=1 Tax=Pleomorphomonas sp. T1.2MG-36 TaxID=3041167 RepID=UPI002477B554|nr:hypothetical protein [Pleomorphomonas sp. T1.2MG-36]CAI9403949.1 hypothetical protein ANOBCDAF_04523 [Pleomorphomonas sp. T1.2MG-36]